MKNNYGNKEVAFSALAGVLYALFGLVHIIEGLGIDTGLSGMLFIPGDILGGFCLVVIGAVFLIGFKEMLQGLNAGVSFVYVGILMSLIFMAVYLLIMGGNLLDSFIVPDDYEGWSVMETFRPGIYLGLLSLAGILYWRDRFSLNEVLVFREGA
ncbi:hypothetical protein [Methanolobus profundi]|uniref:Uncharacterized protein n=1 Tax=Methanolobus profundi TaxID=487685 RepID=A0A1I4QZ78_9EURY|nr:hypothetical protein [Methanolobus profundi]SFM45297.1 hypothetical protein SAMN04488696_1276 [Methanolobus profundi]